jgi:HAD superfamily hydrolase (TIGR01509 family)
MRNYGPDAVIFDLDGVITFTASLHAAAWKQMFDQYLQMRAARDHEPFRPFDIEADYRAYVDGKPRYDGVQSFLESRGINIPYGKPTDAAGVESLCGLGNKKDDEFMRQVQEKGVDVDKEAVRFVEELRASGVQVGLASSSKNAVPILERVGIKHLFDAIVDGAASEGRHLNGKPAPDIFLEALRELTGRVNSRRSGMVEDAIAGVEAGRGGGFGLVLGVDRENSGALARHGANWVIQDFSEISANKVLEFFAARERKVVGQ